MAVIPVDIAGRPYDVHVGAGLLPRLAEIAGPRLRKRRVPIVTDANVHTACGATVEAALSAAGHAAAWRILPPGEDGGLPPGNTVGCVALVRGVQELADLQRERLQHLLEHALDGVVLAQVEDLEKLLRFGGVTAG